MASDDDGEYGYFYDDEDAEEDGVGALEDDAPPPPERRADYLAITQESVSTAQKHDLSTVMNLLDIKQHQARALLIHHRWKIDAICDCFDRKGRDRMLRDAGIVLQDNNSLAEGGSISTKPMGSVTCNVCFEDYSLNAVSTMDCGHCFCNDCWTEHFKESVKSGKKQIQCMEVKCAAFCDEGSVRCLLFSKYPDMAKRFDHFLLESYLEDNDSVKWCPSTPHCGRAIRVGAGERYVEVECPCGFSFCFNCAAQAHSPCPCTIWEKWSAKSCDSENIKWIINNTKSCPKCFKPIEKDGGCNLVRCKCGQYLCYLCGGPTGQEHTWNRIARHSCNRFMEETGGKSRDTTRQQMQRYTHYCDRFKIHGGSYKVEKQKLGPAVAERVKQLESSDLKRPFAMWDGDWLTRAHRRLLVSRQVLSRSYAFAYYMFGGELQTRPAERKVLGVARNLFEDQQERLEHHVERLSKVLAADVPAMPEAEILRAKQETLTLAKTVETLCGEMYKCIQDELLPLLVEPMSVAAYRPDGPDKATELAG